MLIEIAEIPQEGLAVTLRAEPVVLRLLDRGLPTEAHADAVLRLTRTHGGVLAEGEVASTFPLVCSRCSEPFAFPVQEPFSVFYQEPLPATAEEEVELGPADLDTDFLAQGRLDLTALLHENLLLALPAQPLCREDCQGLCPSCGANRNEGGCACPGPPADPRFAILERLRREP